MQLSVCNHLLNRQFINKISFNPIHNILAAIVDTSDTILFYHYQTSPTSFIEIFQGKKTSLSWSSDGVYLALGAANLEIWKFDGKKISPFRTYTQNFIQIKIIVWSPDFKNIAFGGLSKKNAIKFRNIEQDNGKQLQMPLAVSSISYDPFGKYLLVLIRSNVLYIYNSNSLAKIKEVELSPNARLGENINTVKQTRIMGWSPDFNYLVCPSLDDGKISLAISLCRGSNFNISHILVGHVSSICCARFSDILYDYNGQICSILALGDSHGVVSIWRICSKCSQQPLLVCNSYEDSSEVVEQLEWSEDGAHLFVNMMKRYISVLTFEKSHFGREITGDQKANLIQSSYGARSVKDIQQKQIQIFTLNLIRNDDSNHHYEQLPGKAKVRFQVEPTSKLSQQLLEKPQYVKINEQVTTKDKNNKKKIQPAILVRKEEMQKTVISQPNLLTFNHPIMNLSSFYQPLKLKPIQNDTKIGRINNNQYLQLRKIQNFTILQIVQMKQQQKMIINQKVFTGNIDYLRVFERFIYAFNQSNLYILEHTLNWLELPLAIGQVHKIGINELGDIYYMDTSGFIKGFNHLSRKYYTHMPIPIQAIMNAINYDYKALESGQKQQRKYLLSEFTVQSNHNLYISIFNHKNRYFFDRQMYSWVSLELNGGLLTPGFCLKISQQEERLSEQFFKNIGDKIKAIKAEGQCAIQQYESNLIYYKKHMPNKQLYLQNLIGLLKELKVRNMSSRLRKLIQKYFICADGQFAKCEQKLRGRVRAIGGSVIEQFILFGGL